MAAEISPSIMPEQGDDLAAALTLAANTLGESGGSIVIVADTVAESENALAKFRSDNRLPVYFLAVARADTPEYETIRRAASALSGDVSLITPDRADVRSLVRSTAEAPVAIGAAGEGARWAEAGWWLTPVLALLSLTTFRRTRRFQAPETLA
jgi:Ca-activated chloride channel family protein